MLKFSVLTVAVLVFGGALAHGKAGHPFMARPSHLKCYKVGGLIQVGNEIQCAVPVVSAKETVRLCFDHNEVYFDAKNPSFRRSNYEINLVRGTYHPFVSESFRSRLEVPGENKTYIYSHARKFSEFNDADSGNLKVEFSKIIFNQKQTTLGKITIQNQLYCF